MKVCLVRSWFSPMMILHILHVGWEFIGANKVFRRTRLKRVRVHNTCTRKCNTRIEIVEESKGEKRFKYRYTRILRLHLKVTRCGPQIHREIQRDYIVRTKSSLNSYNLAASSFPTEYDTTVQPPSEGKNICKLFSFANVISLSQVTISTLKSQSCQVSIGRRIMF